MPVLWLGSPKHLLAVTGQGRAILISKRVRCPELRRKVQFLGSSLHSFHLLCGLLREKPEPWVSLSFCSSLTGDIISLSYWKKLLNQIFIYIWETFVSIGNTFRFFNWLRDNHYTGKKSIFFFLKTALLRYSSRTTIHPFKVYDSVVFSIHASMCNHHHNPF